AVRLVDAGERPGVVARILGVSPSSLSRWRRFARLPDGLAARPALGPKPRLSDEQLPALEALLREGALAHGWPNHLWTASRVAALDPPPLRNRHPPGPRPKDPKAPKERDQQEAPKPRPPV